MPETPATEPTPPEGRRPTYPAATLVGGAALLLAAYALGFGPLAWVHHHTGWTWIEKVGTVAYVPLFLLVQRWEAAQAFYAWYLGEVWQLPGV